MFHDTTTSNAKYSLVLQMYYDFKQIFYLSYTRLIIALQRTVQSPSIPEYYCISNRREQSSLDWSFVEVICYVRESYSCTLEAVFRVVILLFLKFAITPMLLSSLLLSVLQIFFYDRIQNFPVRQKTRHYFDLLLQNVQTLF